MQSSDQATRTNTFTLYKFAGSTCDAAPRIATPNMSVNSKLKSGKQTWLVKFESLGHSMNYFDKL